MTRNLSAAALAILLASAAAAAFGQGLPRARPEDAGMSSKQLAHLDGIVGDAVVRKDIPGAVILVARKGKTVFRKAYGESRRVPDSRPMTADMIFDLASVTKPVATATSVMILVEQGRVRLWDRVSDFVPGFLPYYHEKGLAGEEARLWHLLTHTSGLPPYTDAGKAAEKLGAPCTSADLAGLIAGIPKESPAGTKFVYSCLNYITLAHIVQTVSGKTLAEFAGENIFKPLGMTRTFYRPPETLQALCVPTEVVEGTLLTGVVHDPLARLQGGISGNAGLFSTADDLAVFAAMLLNMGEWKGARILSPLSVERMTEIYPEVGGFGRGLGWDLGSAYATAGGDLFGPDSYGHTGFTGTSVWIDPETQTAVVFLANSVHPDNKGDIVALRSKVANVVAASVRTK